MMREPGLGSTSRSAALQSLGNERFDVLVIGGGIGAACAAWDAMLRGLKVALVERLDFCGSTSAHSFKVLHGGIRYLQHLDLTRLRESCHERGAFLRTAPHLTHPLPIAVPTYGRGMQSRWLLGTAFAILEMLTLDRNRGLSDPARGIPTPYLLSRRELLNLFPGLERSAPTGAGVFYDGRIRNPPRAVLAVIRAAAAGGAVPVNYCEATDLLYEDGAVAGARVRDLLGGQDFEIRAAVTINATGPYAPDFLRKLPRAPRLEVPLSRDMAIVVRRKLHEDMAVAVQTRYSDPDAVLSRGNRHIILAPWRGKYTLIGVNSRVYRENAYDLQVTEPELVDFVTEINDAYPGMSLTLDDVAVANAGLLPFGENDPAAKDLSFGKRSVIVDHAATDGVRGLVSGMSIRWTMGRVLGARVVDIAERQIRGSVSESFTDRRPVHGGDIASLESLEQSVRIGAGEALSAAQAARFAQSYGSAWRDVLAERGDAPGTIDGTDYLRAEVRYAVRHELAATLNDVILRRFDVGTGEPVAESVLGAFADAMAAELGWDASRREREVASVKSNFPFAAPSRQLPVVAS